MTTTLVTAVSLAPKNLLVLMSDEHNPRAMGCAGHALAQTPHLDRLAARGTRFTSAYCTSPICVPARAGFATGKYPHQVGYWDNADAYEGAVASWHHLLRARGHRMVSIGKLHFRGHEGDDNGFSHLRASLFGPSLQIPIEGGRLALGTWQQIILVDFDNRPRTREVTVQVMGEIG